MNDCINESIAPTQTDDLLLIGDNLDALQSLKKLGKTVEVQYIDPPYNNGNGDLKYNDRRSHAEWIAFMEVRLKIAHDLMTDDGVIFISIDDYEHARLRLLCDTIFSDCTSRTFVWQCKHTVSNDLQLGITSQTEYILCYTKSKFKARRFDLIDDYVKRAYRYDDGNGKGKYRLVPMYKKKAATKYSVTSPTGKVWSLGWNFSESVFHELNRNGDVFWGTDGNAQPQKKVYLSKNKGRSVSNLLLGSQVGYTGDGTKDLRKLFPGRDVQSKFVYPKPVRLIKYLIHLHPRNDITIFDWFAGTGTTQQATAELCSEKKLKHKCVMVCLNENQIDELCKDRLKTICQLHNRSFSIVQLNSTFSNLTPTPKPVTVSL
jgi:adenine-specific DNA-methyltransferase